MTIPITVDGTNALKIDNNTGSPVFSSAPPYVSLGNRYYEVEVGGRQAYDVAGLKLRLLEAGGEAYGFGISSGSLNHVIPGTASHRFYNGTTNSLTVSSTGIATPNLTSIGGDLSIFSVGSSITFNSKNLTNIGAANMTNAVISTRQTAQASNYQTTNTTFSTLSNTISDNNTITIFNGEWSPSNWQSFGDIDCSYSGQVFVLGRLSAGTGVRISKDYGSSWSGWLTPTRPTAGICCDSSGSLIYQSSTDSVETGLWRSYDYGITWTQVDSTNRVYSKLRCTADGKKVVGVVNAVGIFISENSGAAMTSVDGVKNFVSVAMSNQVIYNASKPDGLQHIQYNGRKKESKNDELIEKYTKVRLLRLEMLENLKLKKDKTYKASVEKKWSDEVFETIDVIYSDRITYKRYRVRNIKTGEIYPKTFFAHEMQIIPDIRPVPIQGEKEFVEANKLTASIVTQEPKKKALSKQRLKEERELQAVVAKLNKSKAPVQIQESNSIVRKSARLAQKK